MQYQPDIVISDRSGVAIAIIVVKAINNVTTQIATRYMRNLLSHGIPPRARYLLLITEGAGYLWLSAEAVLRESAPSLIFPMDQIVRHYLPSNGESTSVGDLVLEAVVEAWLFDVTDGFIVDDQVANSLRQTGFLDAVRDGLVNTHATV